ncbi:MAG TPA: phosphoribosyltransferase family protein [Anaerohalosphaeraceae bacterium]|jgi:putative phosphoribosyl transferase|nr:phosphoribosyltransferase family protein [Anaerohalosphaeraceae bacterium]HRT50370.1 phosphoribosyltransferase family protein [Anaerohalosphaeraceae bacterium]HRT86301.1 phosphoribosyltransferase family protein [Anaerohalosphaeraceae bacterium]
MFKDRADAGRQLAEALEIYKEQYPLILAIVRGGVEVGYEVARHLGADFSILVTRKLPFPDNPEAGFGAIAEDGSRYINREAAAWLSGATIREVTEQQKAELKRRVEVLRGGEPLPPMEGRTVILIDDGIAMGSTMRASITLCRNQKAGRIIVGAPVAGLDMAKQVARFADEIVILSCPRNFYAVAQVYENWYDVGDEEVIQILHRWKSEHARAK